MSKRHIFRVDGSATLPVIEAMVVAQGCLPKSTRWHCQTRYYLSACLGPADPGSNNPARQYYRPARECANPTLGLAEFFFVNGLYISVVETREEVSLERKDRVSTTTMTVSTDAQENAHRE